MKLLKGFYVFMGCICVLLAIIGTAIPFLPVFPFLLIAGFCFAKSSSKLHTWFVGTKLYKNNLESFVTQKSMTLATKVKIIISVTAIIVFGFVMMKDILVGKIVLGCVWCLHIIYFLFVVKTTPRINRK